MTIALLLTEPLQAERLVPWGVAIARARKQDLLIIVPETSSNARQWENVDLDSDSDSSEMLKAIRGQLNSMPVEPAAEAELSEKPSGNTEVTVQRFCDPDPGVALLTEIESQSIKLLILPAHWPADTKAPEQAWLRELYRTAPCDTMYLGDDHQHRHEQMRILVVVTQYDDDRVTLQLADRLAAAYQGNITAAIVQPDFDVVARMVGSKILRRRVEGAIGDRAEAVEYRILLSDNLKTGIRSIDPEQFDLVLVATRWHRQIRDVSLSGPFQISDTTSMPALGFVRSGTAWMGRLHTKCRRMVQRFVPQLDRMQRVSLVERVQTSSQWDFDFVALICLSTLIAGLGLVRDSVAVVIGAMLVAPLMTPIVGIGLGLAQCNLRMIRSCSDTVAKGFATALVIGLILGWVVRPELTGEMASRGEPKLHDLIIGLASGFAAAYAMGRPNLLSALPGVAIAAALVPPIATTGMTIATGQWLVAGGSLLLFFANMVAIVLGTTATFWAVGIYRDKKNRSALAWPVWVLLLLALVSFALTLLMPR